MDSPTGLGDPPGEKDWLALAERIEQAFAEISADPLAALAALTAAEEDGRSLVDQVMEHGVNQARQAGRSWSEIARATGVARQAAWRRWTDRGIR